MANSVARLEIPQPAEVLDSYRLQYVLTLFVKQHVGILQGENPQL